MPASKVLETSLVCTRSAQFALSSGVNDDFTCDKVEKKSSTRPDATLLFRGCVATQT
jgi:hypothetical protein